jgi:hypothetical protein
MLCAPVWLIAVSLARKRLPRIAVVALRGDELGAGDDLDALRQAAMAQVKSLRGKPLPNRDTG